MNPNPPFFLLLLAFNVQAADLLSVHRDAVAFDATFAAARAQHRASQEKSPQGRAGLLPTVGLTAATTANDSDSTSRSTGTTTSTQYNNHSWTVTLTQPLFRWQNWTTWKKGELAVIQSEAQLSAAKQDLVLRVAQAYFDILLAQEVLATTRAQQAAIAQQLESAKRNFEVGTTTVTDTHEAQARFDLALAQELAAQNDLTVKHQALAVLTGKMPDRLNPLRPGSQLTAPQPNDMAPWAAMAEEANLTVRQARISLDIADQEAEAQRAGHYPTLDLTATHGRSGTGYSSSSSTGSDSVSSTLGVTLTLPIFSGGATVSKTREAVALREKALADLDVARRAAALAARQAWLGVTSGLAQVKAFEAALASSQSALDSNKLGYEVGVRINIDVLNAQGQLFDTRQKLVKARLESLMSQLKLKAAAGNLTEADVAAVNALLE